MDGPGATDLLDQLQGLLQEYRTILVAVGTKELLEWDCDALDTAFGWAEGIEGVVNGLPTNYEADVSGASLSIIQEARISRQRLAQAIAANGFLLQHPNAAELLQRLSAYLAGDLGGGRTVHAVMADVAASRARGAMALEAVHRLHQSLQGRACAGSDGRRMATELRAYAKAVVQTAQDSPACPAFSDELHSVARDHEHGSELLLFILCEISARRKLPVPSAVQSSLSDPPCRVAPPPSSPPTPLHTTNQADNLSTLTDRVLSWLASWEDGEEEIWETADEGLMLELCEAYPLVADLYAAHLLTNYRKTLGSTDPLDTRQAVRKLRRLSNRSARLRSLVEGLLNKEGLREEVEQMGRGNDNLA